MLILSFRSATGVDLLGLSARCRHASVNFLCALNWLPSINFQFTFARGETKLLDVDRFVSRLAGESTHNERSFGSSGWNRREGRDFVAESRDSLGAMRSRSTWIMSSMDDVKVVLITGGGSEIGASVARLFAQRGFKVAITDSNKEKVDKVAKECTDLSPHGFKVNIRAALEHDLPNTGLVDTKYFIEFNPGLNSSRRSDQQQQWASRRAEDGRPLWQA